jgi:hypothetical protein
MLKKLQPKLLAVWIAVVKQRVAVVIVIAIGVLVAWLAPVAPPVRDVAAHDVTIGNVAVPGFTPPCTAASVPALAKSGAVVNKVGGAPALDANAISTVLRAPGVMAVRYAGNGPLVKSHATSLAGAVAELCNARTAAMLATLKNNLAVVQEQRQADLARVNAQLVPASRETTQAATLTKRYDALEAQRVDAEQKLAVQHKLARSASSQRSALRPLAARQIATKDSLSAALRAQFEKDSAALAAANAQYQDGKYPGLDALVRRVAKDRAAIVERDAQVAKSEPQTLSAEYRAAQAADDQAHAAGEGLAAQIATIKAQQKPLGDEIAKHDAVAVSVAANTLERDALLKAYNAAAAQRYAVEQQAAQIVAEPQIVAVPQSQPKAGGPVSVAAEPEPGVETLGAKLAAAIRIAVALAFVVLASIVALVLNAFDKRLLTVGQITQLYGKPVISILGPKSSA